MSNATQMVLAVDTEHRIYAYTQQELTENLPTLYVTLPFKPWKEGFSYKDGSWSYYNEFYTPPTYLDCFIDPAVQSEEGGAAEEISNLKPMPSPPTPRRGTSPPRRCRCGQDHFEGRRFVHALQPPTTRLTRRRVRRSIRCRFRPGR